MKQAFHNRAISLRTKGFSIAEISARVNVAPSTVSLWVRGVKLSKIAKFRIAERGKIGREKGSKTLLKKRKAVLSSIRHKVEGEWRSYNETKIIKKIVCSLLLRCEGEKTLSSVAFINSDPGLIKLFISSLRQSFIIDENKFRVMLHLHGYHNEKAEKSFWSELTKIPLKKFYKVYKKSNTGKYKHPGYHGCVSIRYYDHKIAKELDLLWQVYIKKHGRVV